MVSQSLPQGGQAYTNDSTLAAGCEKAVRLVIKKSKKKILFFIMTVKFLLVVVLYPA
jgi:hypothetical protein